MTRLVGVECPGQQSIFSKLTLKATPTEGLRNIQYGVSQFGEMHSLVLMDVSAPGLSGTVEAVLRPEPQAQTAFADLEKLVQPGEFAGQLALVAGGSRGLGEVTAKLLAAGGAFVRITYHKGKLDAQRVVDDIVAGGGRADCCELDILHPQAAWRNWAATTHLYYFASPFISASGKHFSPSLFNEFSKYYVNGFAALVEALQKLGLQNVFYPSTVFIDELPPEFAEYALSKSAGELWCRAFAKKHPEMRFYCPRLPKMATDQTVSLRPAQTPDPAPIILTALRNFCGSVK
jgi:NAD(P)-dependent dehydrogenase (short-subunit alcohol dehydrogenase family)